MTGDDFDLNDYNPVYSTYAFKDSVAEPLLLSLLHRKLVRLPKPPRLEGMWKTEDPIYCAYHRMLDHPTTTCSILKDRIQDFVNEGTLRLRPDQRV